VWGHSLTHEPCPDAGCRGFLSTYLKLTIRDTWSDRGDIRYKITKRNKDAILLPIAVLTVTYKNL
jgi:hypothetical protein